MTVQLEGSTAAKRSCCGGDDLKTARRSRRLVGLWTRSALATLTCDPSVLRQSVDLYLRFLLGGEDAKVHEAYQAIVAIARECSQQRYRHGIRMQCSGVLDLPARPRR